MANQTAKLDLRVYRAILWRRRWVILCCLVLGSGLGIYLGMTAVLEYKVRATAMMRELDLEFGGLKRMAPRVTTAEDMGLLKAKLLGPQALDELITSPSMK